MTYFHGSLPAPTTDGFHAALAEFEAASLEGRIPHDAALANALAEFAEPGNAFYGIIYGDEPVSRRDALEDLDHWDNEVEGEDFEAEFRIFLAGIREWVEYWDNFDYGW